MKYFLEGFAAGLAVAIAVYVWRRAIEARLKEEAAKLREAAQRRL